MKIYIGHSRAFDFITELYQPIKESSLVSKHEIIFPHEVPVEKNSKEIIKDCDLMIAEVSFPSTGLGIELGWASDAQCPILCISKQGSKVTSSLQFVCKNFIEYSGGEDMIEKLDQILKNR